MQILQKEDINPEKFNTIRQMILNVKHEINNPLAALLGNVELLLDKDPLDGMIRSRLTVIRELSFRIRDVVKEFPEISDFSAMNYSNGESMIDLYSK